MSFKEGLQTANQITIFFGGPTSKIVSQLFEVEPLLLGNKQAKHAFFTPPKDVIEGFLRALTVVTAPLSSALLAIEMVIYSLKFAVEALYQLAIGSDRAADTGRDAGLALATAVVNLIAIPFSPIINLADIVGSAFVSSPNSQEKSDTQSYSSISRM